MKKTIIVTGSCGLVGSAVSRHFAKLGYQVYGIDNNQREVFFGAPGATWPMQRKLAQELKSSYHHLDIDIRSPAMRDVIKTANPAVIVHAAGQPSHDRSALIPVVDFNINAGGTLNVLEAARQHCPEAPFVFLSTNKVYGDNPNKFRVKEYETRYDYVLHTDGVNEECNIDGCIHSPFGASKLAADIMVQEYGRYYGMPTVCLRAGCITGEDHAGVELHGFLNYLVKCNVKGIPYTIYGYKGKQVRDNIHASDVASFVTEFASAPKCGAVYNIGGGQVNSCSILEAFELVERRTRKKMISTYNEHPRVGDHICYWTCLYSIKDDYPKWSGVTISLGKMIHDMVIAYEKN